MKLDCPFALKTYGVSEIGENEERECRFKFKSCKIIACAMRLVVGEGLGKKAHYEKEGSKILGVKKSEKQRMNLVYLCIPIDLFLCILF